MIKREVIKCRCHKELVRTVKIKGKPFNKKKYYCRVTGTQLLTNNFIYETMTVNLRDPDDTRDGSEVQSQEEIDQAYEDYDYKKKASGE